MFAQCLQRSWPWPFGHLSLADLTATMSGSREVWLSNLRLVPGASERKCQQHFAHLCCAVAFGRSVIDASSRGLSGAASTNPKKQKGIAAPTSSPVANCSGSFALPYPLAFVFEQALLRRSVAQRGPQHELEFGSGKPDRIRLGATRKHKKPRAHVHAPNQTFQAEQTCT